MSASSSHDAVADRGAAPRNLARARRPLAALMTAYIAGDRAAFAQLHAAVEPRVRRQIRTRVINERDLDDLVQLTFMRAHAARCGYVARDHEADEAVAAWYCAIARNIAINFLRSQYRDRLRLDNGDARVGEDVADEQDLERHAVEHELEHERRAVIRAAIERLPPTQRVVVELHKLQGVPMAEVARRLGLRNGAVRVRAHRAYETLKGCVPSRVAALCAANDPRTFAA